MKLPRSLSAFNVYRNKSKGVEKKNTKNKSKKNKNRESIVSVDESKSDFSLLSNKDDEKTSEIKTSDSPSTSNLKKSPRVSFIGNHFGTMDLASDEHESDDKSSDYSDLNESGDNDLKVNYQLINDRRSSLGTANKIKPSNFSSSKLRASGIKKSISKSLPMLKIKSNLRSKKTVGTIIDELNKDEKTKLKPNYLSLIPASQPITLNENLKTLPPYLVDSRVQAQRCFEWLINPFSVDQFFREIWEKKPLLLKRKKEDYYSGVFSTNEFDTILRQQHLLFSKNIDLTSYENDERKTHNGDGRAYAPVVWDNYQNGRSVRLLNPQTFSKSVWKLCSILQEFFGSFVGANCYLTPPNSQGFAPHYDDIEAFILQLEGKKVWKIYAPLTESTTLPRFSSKNFCRDDLKNAEPLLTVTLEPGDLMYFPRGFIHEACTTENVHSLHITLSASQRNTYGDLIEAMMPQAIQSALENDLEFRQSLPRDYLHYMGISNEDKIDPRRYEFIAKLHLLMKKLINHANVDAAVDQKAKDYIHECLPPVINEQIKLSSIHGGGEKWNNGDIVEAIELEPDTQIKFLRYGVVRLVMEDDSVRLYHNLENSREYRQYDKQYIDIDAEKAIAVEFLLNAYPNYIPIEQLPLETIEDKMEIANLLYDKGLITIIEHEEMDDFLN